jgi:hypothetical protein
MHLLLFTPIFADSICVAGSGAAFIVVLTVLALLRSH